jgi:hypothetical protein
MTSIDTNVSNYTLSELMAIVELDDLDPTSIMNSTEPLINKYKNNNPTLSTFFQGVQSQLLQYSQDLYNEDNKGDAKYPTGEKQVNDRYENEYLTQNDQNQNDKITQRKQKIGVFGNEHDPMTRQQLGVNDTFNVSVKQDSLNPNLKNTISRFVNLDSQFRQFSGIDSTSTNYTLDLSDTLKNVLSMRLYSYQIPFSWYLIDPIYNNTCFWITNGNENIAITMPSGNYTSVQFVLKLNNAFKNAGFTFPAVPDYVPIDTPVYYNDNTGKITLFLNGGKYHDPKHLVPGHYVPHPDFTISETTIITFFDFTATLQCNVNCVNNNNYLNQTLGWLMGYRVPYESVIPLFGNTATSVLDLIGTKYLILVIDDYNQNHVNNTLVSITEYTSTLKIPDYYSRDLPTTCNTPGNTNLSQIVTQANLSSQLDNQSSITDNGLLIAGKYTANLTKTQLVLPSAPRTLTQAQIYTINEINKNQSSTNFRAKAPTSSDILAIIPVKTSGASTGNVLVEFSGSLQDNIRTYFGPVNIERMAVKLLNDKGYVLDLNGLDWTITLICDCLYQY